MSTILEALRKLQQDEQQGRKETDQRRPPEEASETDPSFQPIRDPTALDDFVNARTETSSQHDAPQAAEAGRPSVTGLGGDWRDYQPESFRHASAESAGPAELSEFAGSGERIESDEDGLGEGLELAESRLLTGVADSESGVASDPDDDGPSIYDDTRAAEDGGADNQRRNLLIAATALGLGLLLGFFLVRMRFQGDAVVAEGDGVGQTVVDAPSKQGDTVAPLKHAKAEKKIPARSPAAVPTAKSAGALKKKSAAVASAKPAVGPAVGPAVKPTVKPATQPVPKTPVAPVLKPPVAPAASLPVPSEEVVEPEVSLTVPVGAPHVDLVFIQWARDPTNRLVSIRNLKGTLLVLREGDYADPVQGMKVAHIGREWVDFSWKTNLFRISVNDF